MKWSILLLTPLLAGCFGCEPLLEVRHCLDTQCAGSSDAVRLNWTQELADQWPELDAFFGHVELGEHEHKHWTRDKEQALWAAFGVEGDEPELIIQHGEDRYRVRVLTCD